MRATRLVSLCLALALALGIAFPAVAKDKDVKPMKVTVHKRGRAFCPSRTLVYRATIILERGRCFVVTVLRERSGTFLAFLQPGIVVSGNQVIALGSPAGVRLRRQIVYLVPIATTTVLVPVNTIALVPIRVEDFRSRTALVLVEPTSPQVSVVFNIHM